MLQRASHLHFVAGVLLLSFVSNTETASSSSRHAVLLADAPYIVDTEDGHTAMAALQRVLVGLGVVHTHHPFGADNEHNTFIVHMSASEAVLVGALPYVTAVTLDSVVSTQADSCAYDTTFSASSPNTNWGVPRVTTPAGITDGAAYTPGQRGNGITVYVLDTGVFCEHRYLNGRCTYGTSYGTGDYSTADDNGHGSHVAGIVASTQYGVAPDATIVSHKVLNAEGEGRLSGIIIALSGIHTARQSAGLGAQAVINLSIAADRDTTSRMQRSVDFMVQEGYTVVVGAGNQARDACIVDPAATEAITVGASDQSDNFATFSNLGSCIDILAPGVNILSIWNSDNSAIANGTSQSAPHVAGLAAIYLQKNPGTTGSQVKQFFLNNARLSSDPRLASTGTTNKIAYYSCYFAGMQQTDSTTTPLPLSPPTAVEARMVSSDDSDSGIETWVVAALIGSGVLCFVCVALVLLCCMRGGGTEGKQQKQKKQQRQDNAVPQSGPKHTPRPLPLPVQGQPLYAVQGQHVNQGVSYSPQPYPQPYPQPHVQPIPWTR